MITTLCLNPAFDKTASLEKMLPNGLNLLENSRMDVGGKGINVARTLSKLGIPCHCVGCLGTENAAQFMDKQKETGVSFRYMPLPGLTRTNLKVFDRSTSSITEFNEPGPTMDSQHQEHFFSFLKKEAKGSETIVFSGRMPVGCPEDLYARWMKALPDHHFVLDAAGDALLAGLAQKPMLIKPNLVELSAIADGPLHGLASICGAARKLLHLGAQRVIVSMGAEGALYVDSTSALFAPALPVQVRSTVGAGDAMVAGFLTGRAQGEPWAEAFRFAVAAAGASVITEGTQPLTREDFLLLLPRVTLQEVNA